MDDDGVSTDRFRFCAFLWDDILLYIDGLLDAAAARFGASLFFEPHKKPSAKFNH